MIGETKYPRQILILIFLAYLFFIWGNGIVALTNPDEVFYAQTAKEMIQHKSWMTPYLFGQPQFEKPIFTFWLLRIGFFLFGVSSFAARFFPSIFGILGVLSVYSLGLAGFKDERKAFLSSLILMSCGLYVGLARTVFTDLIFSVFILLALLSFFWGYSLQEKKAAGIIFFAVFSSLAVLTKGPLGLLIPFLTVLLFLFIKNDLKFLLSKYSLWSILIFALISLPWYVFMINKYGHSFIHEFFYNDHIRRIIEAEHPGNDRWYFYPLSMLGCISPWSLFTVASLAFLPRHLRGKKESFSLFLACWICVVFLIFQFAHSKLASYIFPLFPALALITGGFIYDALQSNRRNRLLRIISLGTLFTLSLIPLGLSIGLIKYSAYISSYLPSKIPIYFLIAIFLTLIISMLFFILRNKLFKNICSLALVIPAFLFTLPFVHNDIEPYFASKEACAYLLKNYTVNNTILSSKPFVRGVRYYTDKDVAVIDIPGTPFFSPHPISFLNSGQKVRDFLRRQSLTYCILKKRSVVDIKRLTAEEFKYTILNIIGNEYIVKIEYSP